MRAWLPRLARLLHPAAGADRGQGLVEYALLIACIAILTIGALIALRQPLSAMYQHIASCLGNPSGC